MNFRQRLTRLFWRLYDIPDRIDALQQAVGRLESRLLASTHAGIHPPIDYEFKVYSQWGEDGIIDYLLRHVPIATKTFVEFGVEDYTEANTLFLLKHRNWRGLVIDGSPSNVESIRRGQVFWRYDLAAECSFITTANIDSIIRRHGFDGDLGLLSIDIDGNDYWVWHVIESVSPRIVVVEYNALFGQRAKISVPYEPDFQRNCSHASKLYYGASIAALTHLAELRGYSLVAGNSAGNNAFFVRNDCLGALRPLAPEDAYVAAAFRETRGPDGSVQLLTFRERQSAILDMPVVEVVTGRLASMKDFL
jgi:hypothetical protein